MPMPTITNANQVLSGHIDAETAFVCPDYPYGYRLRCKIRYWLDINKNGTRLVSQTTNPKAPVERWNKPKASTYSDVGVMYLDDDNHVTWVAVSLAYDDIDDLRTFAELTAGKLQEAQENRLGLMIKLREKYNAMKAAAAVTA